MFTVGIENFTPSHFCSESMSQDLVQKFMALHTQNGNAAYLRTHFDDGHFTGSALLIDRHKSKTLLTHHKKLNRWLQLGGHADGDENLYAVAKRETEEESGLPASSITPILSKKTHQPICLEFDRHIIPARKTEPEHYHYDVCFLFHADSETPFEVSDESNDLRWFDLEEAFQFVEDESLRRKLNLVISLKNSLTV